MPTISTKPTPRQTRLWCPLGQRLGEKGHELLHGRALKEAELGQVVFGRKHPLCLALTHHGLGRGEEVKWRVAHKHRADATENIFMAGCGMRGRRWATAEGGPRQKGRVGRGGETSFFDKKSLPHSCTLGIAPAPSPSHSYSHPNPHEACGGRRRRRPRGRGQATSCRADAAPWWPEW